MAVSKSSAATRENLVEEIAETSFEHVDLDRGHRRGLGPVVGHDPRRRIAARKPPWRTSRRPRIISPRRPRTRRRFTNSARQPA